MASRMTEAAGNMVVDQATGLHKGVADGGTDKLKAAFFQGFRECIRGRGGGRDFRKRGGLGDLRIVVHKRPDKL